MKKSAVLFALFSLIFGFNARAQIVTAYQQGFESSGETSSYVVVQGTASPQTAFHTSGSRALQMTRTSTEVIVMTDTIDLRSNSTLQYFMLEFMHICTANPNDGASASSVATVEVRSVYGDWQQLQGNGAYDMGWGGGSVDFAQNSSFSRQSYPIWAGVVDNRSWKRERFNLGNVFTNMPMDQRQMQVRFRFKPTTVNNPTPNQYWYLDNVSLKASPQSLAIPVITMTHLPDLDAYPTSRSTRIECEVSTSAAAGMCADSIYILYRLGTGNNVTTDRVQMSPVPGHANRYRGYIPFAGYDTTIYYRVVTKDATTNHNAATYPQDETGWATYYCVRGSFNQANASAGTIVGAAYSTTSEYPFPNNGSSKSQFIYPKDELRRAGFKPGAITMLNFIAGNTSWGSQHLNMQVRMANIDTFYSNVISALGSAPFYDGYMKVVYDSSMSISLSSNTSGTINFQDTFFYAGQDILVQILYHNYPSGDPTAVAVRTYGSNVTAYSRSAKATLYGHYQSSNALNPYTHDQFRSGVVDSLKRPDFFFRAWPNPALIHDVGVSGLITPNDSTSASAVAPNNVIVNLQNYGVNTVNAVRIYYQIDDSATHYYDWTGSLAGNSSVQVTLTSTQMLSHGYHNICAWTDDSITSAGFRYRDHEPLNNQLCSRFVSCSGPMSGTVTCGSASSDYNTIENLLYVLSQCGVNGPLTVNLVPGTYYGPILFPTIPGTSVTNYIQFQPSNGVLGSVTFSTQGAAQYVLNLANANHIRLNKLVITFNNNAVVQYPLRFGMNSTGCQVLNCRFEEAYHYSTAQLYSGGADSLLVKDCLFARGRIGISMVGPASDNMAHGNRIEGCLVNSPQNTGIILRNQVNGVIDSCWVTGVTSNASYCILLQDCAGATRVTRNVVYTTKGAPAIGATDFNGSPNGYAVIANNMLICDDDGTANMLVTPLNFITATYTKVIYNSVKMNAPAFAGVAAATFGGGVIDSCYFFNNIVSCMDTSNYAFNFIPNAGNVNYIGYNIYYSRSGLLNKYNGINCTSFSQWQSIVSDAASQNVNPAFLFSTVTDLRSYSQNVRHHGLASYFPEVTTDIYGTVRDSVSSCVGAFEFSSLPYDFEVYELVEPFEEYCSVPSQVPVRIAIKNSGVNTYTGTGLSVSFNVNGQPGQASYTIPISDSLPGETITIVNLGQNISIPTNGIRDSVHRLNFWLNSSSLDPNPANDTSTYQVTSRYHFPAVTTVHDTISYGTADTLTLTQGVQTWPVNFFNSGRKDPSTLYWYTHPDSSYFFVGNPVITPILYTDTMYYVRQRRNMPLMKITEVQTKNNGLGVTYPQQLWMNSATQFAVELTNVGDAPARLLGDTLQLVSNTNNLNRVYVFPDVTVQPGQCMVVQYRASITVDSNYTLGATATVSPNATANLGIIYRDGNGITDAVAVNSITTQTQWTNLNVPSTVWSGEGITMNNQTAGYYRIGWPSNPNGTPGSTRQLWLTADSVNIMTLGEPSAHLVRYTDNGCPADTAHVHIHIDSRPAVDIALDQLTLPEGCGLSNEQVTVVMHNYGAYTSGSFAAHYSVNGVLTCTDTISPIASNATIVHNFSLPINMYVASGMQEYDVVVWVDAQTGDISLFNDTTSAHSYSSYTPAAPVVVTYDTVQYGERDTLTTVLPSVDSLGWYDRNGNFLGNVNTFISDYLYVNDTFYVSAFGQDPHTIHVGTLATATGNTAHPSPYCPNSKYTKEQYLYLAEDLINAGHTAGPISAISFYLDSVISPAANPNPSFTFDVLSIGMGQTSDLNFNANNAWKATTNVFSATNVTYSNADKGWITHQFASPFLWDGVSNIVVEVVHTATTNLTTGARTRYTTGPSQTTIYKSDNATTDIANYSGNGSRSANRPDIQFTFVDLGCEGPTSPVYVAVIGTPDIDASLEWPDGIDTVQFSSCGANNFDVKVRNRGLATINSYTIEYWVDDVHGVYTSSAPIASQNVSTLTIATPSFDPGRHVLHAIISTNNDTVPTNDTIHRMINVTFCAGTYTIGPASTNDYLSFNEAIDTLYNAGIAGPVVFSVQNGLYEEQITLGAVNGTSSTNTITFRGSTSDSSAVELRYATAQNSNFVVNLDGANYTYFNNMTIASLPTGNVNYGHVVLIANSDHIGFNKTVIRVKETINNANASAVVVGEGVNYLSFDSCVILNGYYGIKAIIPTEGTNAGFRFDDGEVRNFWSQGIALRKFNDVVIRRNQINGGVTVNSRALTGLLVTEVNGGVDIERNNVVLYDTKNGGKRGIVIINCIADNTIRGRLYNNMSAVYGTGTSGQSSAGIWIDSSRYLNVYYNSCRVYAGLNAAATRAFSVQTNSSNIYALNNIFANNSKGYALYAQSAINIATCNYNVYFSTGDTNRLCYWGEEVTSLAAMRAVNNQDANSYNESPYYVSANDLHLSIAQFAEKAQYNTEVPTDINGQIRPQIPQPCIGAHEPVRDPHDISILEFIQPTLDSNTVETDSLRVIVKLYNNGTSTETNVRWYAYIENTESYNNGQNLRTVTRTIEEMVPTEAVFDTAYIELPLGLIDTNHIHAIISFAPGVNYIERDTVNNHTDTVFMLEPAFDIRAEWVAINDSLSGVHGCRLQETPVSMRIINVGRKAIPSAYPLTVGYQARVQTANVTVNTLPQGTIETLSMPDDLAVNGFIDFTFQTPANLYPTGNERDVQLQIRSWGTFIYDQKHAFNLQGRDTTAWTNVTSKYTPNKPTGPDLHIPYATWDTIKATHTDNPGNTLVHRPIRWYKDSTDAEPYYAPNNYNQSTWWETPQYFRDTVYYLSCISSTGCTSYYQPIHVYINPRVPTDASITQIVTPYSKVYMFNDTVKVRITNYGTQAITNIPVTYQLRQGLNAHATPLQEVTETCHVTIQPDQSYIFAFDSLAYFPTNPLTSQQNYTIRAWTDLNNEQTRLNDTIRNLAVFHQKLENGVVDANGNFNSYSTPEIGNPAGHDITRVSYNTIDQITPEVGHTYINFGNFNNPEVPVLYMVKGTTDTMLVTFANNSRHDDYHSQAFLTVYVDYNQDGYFSAGNEWEDIHGFNIYKGEEVIFADTVYCRQPIKFVYTLPDSCNLGYTRMRVCLHQTQTDSSAMLEPFSFDFGQVQDYLLYVEDVPADVDAGLGRVVSPVNNIISGPDSTVVTFMLCNKGGENLEAATIHYRTIRDNGHSNNSITWTGWLEPGQSAPVSLPAAYMNEGTTRYTIWVETAGDTITYNDTLRCEFHRFPVKTLIIADDFDNLSINQWYAPAGYNNYSRNVWVRNYPYNKPHLSYCMSDSLAYITGNEGMLNTGKRGSLSYLYSPLIDISQIRPDTITFWMAHQLGDGARIYWEFWDWQSSWQRLGSMNDTLWYNDPTGITGTSSGYAFTEFRYPTSHSSGDFQQTLQFRIVYEAPEDVPAAEGAVLDNLVIGRARRAIDVGVTSIIYPTEPRFGETIYPKVTIHNYGYDTARSVSLAYVPYGSFLAKVGTYDGTIPPGESVIYTFTEPFVVMADFPDTFQIFAYTTVDMDIYHENDSVFQDFYLAPLDDDMAVTDILYPLDHIVAGDSIQVTARLRNYGQQTASGCDVVYVFNNAFTVTEHVDFNALLGRPLGSFEYYNYTFQRRCRASMGNMPLEVYVIYDGDGYPYNDTVNKSIQGLQNITDLSARAIVIDTSNSDNVTFQLTIDNIGSRSANNFTVGYWYDNDTSTMVIEHFNAGLPLAALHTCYYVFDSVQPRRAGNPYVYVSGFVHIDGDNDNTNDTTSVIENQYVDLHALRVVVEENREETCHVRVELENLGNMSYNRNFRANATVNGTTLYAITDRVISPGEAFSIVLNGTIPKSSTRSYSGTGFLTMPYDDHTDPWSDVNPNNNQTSIVDVENYYNPDGIDDVSANGMTLDQNVPNPFNAETRIDFSIPTAGQVRFFVMDALGRLVYQSENEFSEGDHSITFGKQLGATGTYFYGIEFNGERLIRKMVFTK
ncbi:MAG: hypothetical protein II532_00630 [Bacteroidales bacterium]|nr:hypothetical protein [Bacteroidales bacterium]